MMLTLFALCANLVVMRVFAGGASGNGVIAFLCLLVLFDVLDLMQSLDCVVWGFCSAKLLFIEVGLWP